MRRNSPTQQEIPFEALDPKRIQVEGARKLALDQGRTRLLVTGVMFALAFSVLGARLVDLTQHGKDSSTKWHALAAAKSAEHVVTRGGVYDRNGRGFIQPRFVVAVGGVVVHVVHFLC